jgi:DNA polymerase-4
LIEAAVEYAQRVRARIRDEVGMAVSAGVSTQKMVAKIACDEAKPNGLKAVAAGTEADFLAPMPVGRLWGIGPKTQLRLAAEHLETIGQLAALSDEALLRLFGRWGREVRELARGNDTRKVEPDRETRSVSSETTFEYDVRDYVELRATLRELAVDVAERLEKYGLRGTTIGIKIKRDDFTIVGRQMSIAEPTRDARIIEAAAQRCLDRAELGEHAVRLLGVRVAAITEDTAGAAEQISMFTP